MENQFEVLNERTSSPKEEEKAEPTIEVTKLPW